jgi:hypothetical protein
MHDVIINTPFGLLFLVLCNLTPTWMCHPWLLSCRKEQEKLEMVLSGKKLEHKLIDIATIDGAKDKMRELMSDPKALPPQFFLGDKHLGVSVH